MRLREKERVVRQLKFYDQTCLQLIIGSCSVLVKGGEIHRVLLGAGLDCFSVTLDCKLVATTAEKFVT